MLEVVVQGRVVTDQRLEAQILVDLVPLIHVLLLKRVDLRRIKF